MDKSEFRAEKLYLMSRSVAKRMLERGMISEEEYLKIDTILLRKYEPPLSVLLSGKRLI